MTVPVLCCYLKRRPWFRQDGDVAKWLNGLKEGRRVLEEAFGYISARAIPCPSHARHRGPNKDCIRTLCAGSPHAGCSKPLYSSAHKFKHACGCFLLWPTDCSPTCTGPNPWWVAGHEKSRNPVQQLRRSCRPYLQAYSHPVGSQERHCVNSASIVFSPSQALHRTRKRAAALLPALVAPPQLSREDPELSA